jgi:hypothetical protein
MPLVPEFYAHCSAGNSADAFRVAASHPGFGTVEWEGGLKRACAGRHHELVKRILNHGICDWSHKALNDALCEACRAAHAGIVRTLVGFMYESCVDWPRAHVAAYYGGDEALIAFCARTEVDLNGGPLREACHGGQLELVKSIITETRASIYSMTNVQLFKDAVVAACTRDHVDVVTYLHTYRASCLHNFFGGNIIYDTRDYALIAACEHGSVNTFKYLCSIAASIPHGSTYETLVRAAACGGHMDIVPTVLDWHTANPWTSFSRCAHAARTGACRNGSVKLFKFIQAYYASEPITDYDIDNWIQSACERGHFDLVEYLVEQYRDRLNWPEYCEALQRYAGYHANLTRIAHLDTPTDINLDWDLVLFGAGENGHFDIVDIAYPRRMFFGTMSRFLLIREFISMCSAGNVYIVKMMYPHVAHHMEENDWFCVIVALYQQERPAVLRYLLPFVERTPIFQHSWVCAVISLRLVVFEIGTCVPECDVDSVLRAGLDLHHMMTRLRYMPTTVLERLCQHWTEYKDYVRTLCATRILPTDVMHIVCEYISPFEQPPQAPSRFIHYLKNIFHI